MSVLNPIQLIIITGMSGAGKTIAVKSLEDLGFFCVDNLPPVLIPKFAELIKHSQGKIERIALVIDLRGREFFDSLSSALDELDELGISHQILFLDANDDTLVRRYKETRGRHPMAPDAPPLEGILKERKLLEDIKGRAHQIIDTSMIKPAELKEKIIQRFSNFTANTILSINVVSFGFKYGIPIDADLVFDVRFLPNPHYVPELKPKTGCDQEVSQYVLKWTETQQFLQRLIDFLSYLIPHYQREGKSQLVIAIGCTGGKHRSVTIAEYLKDYFSKEYTCRVSHRDIGKDR
jgi:UPF0042 nucleotide-binding protein